MEKTDYFLGELMDFVSEEHSRHVGLKALRIHNKCMRAGKKELALRIKDKYNRKFPQFDLVIATEMLLLSNISPKNK